MLSKNTCIQRLIVISTVKLRKIRFEDDATHDPSAEEKDTRLKLKPAVSALQVRMLQMAKMEVPMIPEQAQVGILE